MNSPEPVDPEFLVTVNRLIVQATVSETAWTALEAMGDSELREALESSLANGFLTEKNGLFTVTDSGRQKLTDQGFL
jgi:hypothetical protein